MVDSVLLIGCAMLAGPALALAPWPTATGATALLFLLRRRAAPHALALALLGLAVSAVRAQGALAGAKALHQRAVAALTPPARCIGRAVVAHAPIVRGRNATTSDTDDDDGRHGCVDLDLEQVDCDDRPLPSPLRARVYGAPETLARGDAVDVVVDLAPVHLFLNEGGGDPWPAIARSGVVASGGALSVELVDRTPAITSFIDRARARVRARIDATFHPEADALARALVLGESDLDAVDDEAFRMSGLAHLLAVSGTHLVITVLALARALRWALTRTALAARLDCGRIVAAIALPLVWIYADFAGGSGSAVRAAAMLSGAMIARALGRKPSGVRTFAASLLTSAVVDPLVGCDISFALSAAATAGLLLFGPRFVACARGPKPVRRVMEAIATTLAAMIGCAPLLATIAPTLPVLGLAANLVAAPVGELAALPLCLGHAALAWLPWVERAVAVLASGALLIVCSIARATTNTGLAVPVPPPSAWQIAVLAVGGTAAFVMNGRRARLHAVALVAVAYVALEAGARLDGSPRGRLRVTVLDVGQGDAALVDLPDGTCMLVDGGGFVGSPLDVGERVLLPLLRARRRTRVDTVVLTHPHPDHFGGLLSALPRLDVGAFWDTGQGEQQGAGASYASLLRGLRQRGVPIVRPDALCGPARAIGGTLVEVLAPCPAIEPDANPNDNSFVLRIRYGDRAALLVGDAERAEEARLLAARAPSLHADLLKIGHHGSRTSTSAAFLAAVAPRHATVSTGVRNRFGHPNADVLARLAAAGVDALRTDRGGEIVWSTDGRSVDLARPFGR